MRCRLASGGSFAVRQLYTDRDEVLFQAARPIILNGIEDVITRPDLADRAIFVTLPHLQEERRRAEKEIWCDFESAHPHILGALIASPTRGSTGTAATDGGLRNSLRNGFLPRGRLFACL
jgi:hypothetical protein